MGKIWNSILEVGRHFKWVLFGPDRVGVPPRPFEPLGAAFRAAQELNVNAEQAVADLANAGRLGLSVKGPALPRRPEPHNCRCRIELKPEFKEALENAQAHCDYVARKSREMGLALIERDPVRLAGEVAKLTEATMRATMLSRATTVRDISQLAKTIGIDPEKVAFDVTGERWADVPPERRTAQAQQLHEQSWQSMVVPSPTLAVTGVVEAGPGSELKTIGSVEEIAVELGDKIVDIDRERGVILIDDRNGVKRSAYVLDRPNPKSVETVDDNTIRVTWEEKAELWPQRPLGLKELNALTNEIKADYNAHRSSESKQTSAPVDGRYACAAGGDEEEPEPEPSARLEYRRKF